MTGKKIMSGEVDNRDKRGVIISNKLSGNKRKKMTAEEIAADVREKNKVTQQELRNRDREGYNDYHRKLQNKRVINPAYGKNEDGKDKIAEDLVAQIPKKQRDLIKKETIKSKRFTTLKAKYNKLLKKTPNNLLYQQITILFKPKKIYVDSVTAVSNKDPVMSASSSSASQQSVSGTISDDDNFVLLSSGTVASLCQNSIFNSNNRFKDRFLPLPDPDIFYPSYLLGRDPSFK